MSWRVEYIEKENIIKVTLEGILDFDAVAEVTRKQIEESKKYNVTKVLVDSSLLDLTVNRTELFELSSSLYNEWQMDPSTQIAIVQSKNQNTIAMGDFYVLAAQNLGWNIKIFPDLKKAYEWLRE